MGKTALITGVTGQDGSYLAEFLLSLGYSKVHGIIRRASQLNTSRLENIYQTPQTHNRRFELHYGDLSDNARLAALIGSIRPDELYNLAAQSHVDVSFKEPVYTIDIGGRAVGSLLESVRILSPETRVYQASTSEMFGDSPSPQGLQTQFRPRSPYAVAKLMSHHLASVYREAYGMFVSSGVLFNHESFRRGPTFVTKKITQAAARIKEGYQDKLFLGNVHARRDWGYAPEYVVGIWASLQAGKAGDFILASGDQISVLEFATRSFEVLRLDVEDHLQIDGLYLRPSDVEDLRGDIHSGTAPMNWQSAKSGLQLAELMVEEDMKALQSNGPSAYLDSINWEEIMGRVLRG